MRTELTSARDHRHRPHRAILAQHGIADDQRGVVNKTGFGQLRVDAVKRAKIAFHSERPISKRGVNIRYHNPKRMTPRACADRRG